MISKHRFITVYLLLVLAGLFVHLHTDVTVPLNRSFALFPSEVAAWQMTSQTSFNERLLGVLKPTDYLYRLYRTAAGRQAELYIGYHGGGENGGEIHSPKHCLPGSGWFEASSRKVRLDVNGKGIEFVQAVYQLGERQELFLYWFQVRDQTLTSEYGLKAAEIVNSLRYRRRDAAFIRVSLPLRADTAETVAAGEQFVRDFYPLIAQFLPK